jgi:hypothetical protein
MAQAKQAKKDEKDIITRLADAGEDAIQRLGELPGGKTMVETANAFRERIDDLATRIRRIDPLEKRVTKLEQRLDALEPAAKPPARKPATRRKPVGSVVPEAAPAAPAEPSGGPAGDPEPDRPGQ